MKMSNLLAAIIMATVTPLALAGQTVGTSTNKVEIANMTAGVVKKLDNDQQKITLKHEALENLGMPPMTMVFRLGNISLVDKLKVGDHIMFRAEQINGIFVVTAMNKVHAIYSPALQ